jgi:hypothetical protein
MSFFKIECHRILHILINILHFKIAPCIPHTGINFKLLMLRTINLISEKNINIKIIVNKNKLFIILGSVCFVMKHFEKTFGGDNFLSHPQF